MSDPMINVRQSAARYADAATLLSNTIIELDEVLNALPAKREVSITVEGYRSIVFKRVKESRWGIVYETLSDILQTGQQNHIARQLRDCSLDIKMEAAPKLPLLLAKLIDTMNQDAKTAEVSSAVVKQLIRSLKKEGK